MPLNTPRFYSLKASKSMPVVMDAQNASWGNPGWIGGSQEWSQNADSKVIPRSFFTCRWTTDSIMHEKCSMHSPHGFHWYTRYNSHQEWRKEGWISVEMTRGCCLWLALEPLHGSWKHWALTVGELGKTNLRQSTVNWSQSVKVRRPSKGGWPCASKNQLRAGPGV